MNDATDDEAFALGLPTRGEIYEQQCALLETELADSYQEVRHCRQRIAKLVRMADELTGERDRLRAALNRLQG
ncbi:MAG: hypothetical protein PW845_18030 [Pseudomonas sp.]|uniref:hypothetical protein n=1 Tax=Pseudomonas abieticivorans TaxID=2931382 RepID=UPI0020BE2082|nr:hypothetical protein [Pseudomonas sp. PIA16]MDE1167217.1 hypothetical protein [Pseudomonas sp.]